MNEDSDLPVGSQNIVDDVSAVWGVSGAEQGFVLQKSVGLWVRGVVGAAPWWGVEATVSIVTVTQVNLSSNAVVSTGSDHRCDIP